MLVKIYLDNPNAREVKRVVDLLRDGGIIIYPTDTIYGIGCDIHHARSIEKVCKIKGLTGKDNLTFLFNDLSQISNYTKPLGNSIFKLIKKNLPGPFTFILPANNHVPKFFDSRKKTVGIRIPDNNIVREIIRELGNPILSTSILDDDDIVEYTTDPELIHEKYKDLVDLVIDGGFGGNIPSTIIDCTGSEFEITRQGKGELEF